MISVLLAALVACSPAVTPVQEAPAAPVVVEAVPTLPVVVETIEVKQAETTAPAATTTPATTTGT